MAKKNDMDQSDQPWKIVSFHRPPYHTHSSRENKEIREAWSPVFDELGIDLVLTGHDHTYMRTWPLVDGEIASEGTIYVIGGVAGPRPRTRQAIHGCMFPPIILSHILPLRLTGAS